ncbi:MAG: hypothetical protein U5K37_11490 [Natrialbaceae archaeon]|nr:hypothetical protein [Natrialbaceae archaeon]
MNDIAVLGSYRGRGGGAAISVYIDGDRFRWRSCRWGAGGDADGIDGLRRKRGRAHRRADVAGPSRDGHEPDLGSTAAGGQCRASR